MKKLLLSTFLILSFLIAYQLSVSAAILVVSTKGEAAYLAGKQWKPLKKGQSLTEGVKVSTGVNSLIVLNIDGSIVTIKPVSSVKVYKNLATGSSRETSLGLQYGSVRAKIDKIERVKTKFNVTTPVATSSVRGTDETISFGPARGMRIAVAEGIIAAFNKRGVSNTIRPRQSFNLPGGSSRPDSVIGEIKNQATVNISAKGLSREEFDSVRLDVVQGTENLFDAVNKSDANINLTIGYP